MPKFRNDFLVDSHCHIDLYKTPVETVRSADRYRVYTIAVTNAPFVFQNTVDLVSGSRFAKPAIGLHPELVATHGKQLEMIPSLLKETRYVGEIGLDYTTEDGGLRSKQRRVFAQILEWCDGYGDKILTLHSIETGVSGCDFNGGRHVPWEGDPSLVYRDRQESRAGGR